jgi:hypothetical protein
MIKVNIIMPLSHTFNQTSKKCYTFNHLSYCREFMGNYFVGTKFTVVIPIHILDVKTPLKNMEALLRG